MKRSTPVLALSCAALCLFITAGCSRKSASDNSSVVAAASTNTNTASSATPKPKPTRPAPDFTVTATGLAMESKVESDMAKEKYKGKQLVVSGRIDIVSTDERMEVLLSSSGVTDFVACKFDEEEKTSLAALKSGQNVTLQCEGDFDTLSRPEPKHCVVVKAE